MKQRRSLLVAILVVALIIVVTIVYLRLTQPIGFPALVAPIDSRAYFAAVDSLLKGATSSVDVILYQSRFYFQYPLSKSNRLLLDLLDAVDRGVEVRAILEEADWNTENSEENRDVWNVLRNGGVDAYFDPLRRTSHSKLVIIDGRYVIVGSSNWSHYSLDINNEANVIVDSKKAASKFTDYFEKILAKSSKTYTSALPKMNASEAAKSEQRYFVIVDVADSAKYRQDGGEGLIYFDDIPVSVSDRPLEEILAVDSLFFEEAPGETLRIVANRWEHDGSITLAAMDVEKGDTFVRMLRAAQAERKKAKQLPHEPVTIKWYKALRVIPAMNELYAKEVFNLIEHSTERIWIAILDARYYDSTPRHATKTKKPGEAPSLTNVLLAKLVSAEAGGVDVRFVCDMGWRGEPPRSKVEFLKRLSAAGASVFEDPRDVTTHAKVAIFDHDFVVVGSTNWSYYALEENNETAVVIECRELNEHYAEFIMALGAKRFQAGAEGMPLEVDGDRVALIETRPLVN